MRIFFNMKNLFGINIDNCENKENPELDGKIFITQNIPHNLQAQLDEAWDQDDQFKQSLSFPSWFYIIKFVLTLGAICFTMGILKADVSFSEGYRNAPYIYWITPVLWIAFISMIILERKRTKKILSSEDLSEHCRNISSLMCEAEDYLEIPENAFNIDVLMFQYTETGDKQKRKNFPFFSHINLNCRTYVKNENLCLSDLNCVMEIPLQSLKSVHAEKKKASFPNWYKDEPFNSKTYKPFKITCNNQGNYYAKYYVVEIQDIKGEFELFIPNYDIDRFCSLTGLNIDEK